MNLIQEFSLLFVVVLPVAIVVVTNIVLAFTGESGTLLFPAIGDFPSEAKA